MSKQLTITVPDGYDEDVTHIVLVANTARNTGLYGESRPVYAVTVLDADGVEIEEVGEGPLGEIMTDAARIVRTGTAVKS